MWCIKTFFFNHESLLRVLIRVGCLKGKIVDWCFHQVRLLVYVFFILVHVYVLDLKVFIGRSSATDQVDILKRLIVMLNNLWTNCFLLYIQLCLIAHHQRLTVCTCQASIVLLFSLDELFCINIWKGRDRLKPCISAWSWGLNWGNSLFYPTRSKWRWGGLNWIIIMWIFSNKVHWGYLALRTRPDHICIVNEHAISYRACEFWSIFVTIHWSQYGFVKARFILAQEIPFYVKHLILNYFGLTKVIILLLLFFSFFHNDAFLKGCIQVHFECFLL